MSKVLLCTVKSSATQMLCDFPFKTKKLKLKKKKSFRMNWLYSIQKCQGVGGLHCWNGCLTILPFRNMKLALLQHVSIHLFKKFPHSCSIWCMTLQTWTYTGTFLPVVPWVNWNSESLTLLLSNQLCWRWGGYLHHWKQFYSMHISINPWQTKLKSNPNNFRSLFSDIDLYISFTE